MQLVQVACVQASQRDVGDCADVEGVHAELRCLSHVSEYAVHAAPCSTLQLRMVRQIWKIGGVR